MVKVSLALSQPRIADASDLPLIVLQYPLATGQGGIERGAVSDVKR